jgi:hypothetical protein
VARTKSGACQDDQRPAGQIELQRLRDRALELAPRSDPYDPRWDDYIEAELALNTAYPVRRGR